MPIGSKRVAAFAAIVTAALMAGCGTPGLPSATPTATPKPPPSSPTPSPTPDSESVSVVASGVGTYLLAAIPVAVLHNDAKGHAAAGVIAHFTTLSRNGGHLGSLDSVPVNLVAGETLAVAADCTDACNNAAGTDVIVTVSSWHETPGVELTASGAAYQCGTCRGGHGYGHVSGMLSAANLGNGAVVTAFAVCHDGGGGILGGGSAQLQWPGGSTSSVEVAVVINDQPATCDLGASTGW
jgi:hypothetical protein